MPLDNLTTLVGKVQQRVGLFPAYHLIVDWLVNGTREIYRERDWTFRRKRSDFLFNAVYATGTATVERGSNIVNFGGAAAITDDMAGRQLRIGGNTMPIATIRRRVTSQRVEIYETWAEATQTAQSFEIYNAFVTVPYDFDSFIAIADLRRNMQINWWDWTIGDLEAVDPQRARGGGDQAFAIVLRDFAQDGAGVVGTLIQVRGSGNRPTSGGQYLGVEGGTFTVEMTDADTFKWKKNGGGYTTGVDIDSAGTEQSLQDGVTIAFPTGVAYTSCDVFVIPCSAAQNAGNARYEPWPHIKSAEARPYVYLSKPLDLNDPGAVLHRFIPTDLVLEKALAAAARWKSEGNGYYDLKLSALHESRYQMMLVDVVREDEARESLMLTYDSWSRLPAYDSEYLAGHDVGYD